MFAPRDDIDWRQPTDRQHGCGGEEKGERLRGCG